MGPPTQEEVAAKLCWRQTPRRGCDGEDTQGEGPNPRSVGAVFNPGPWDSSSPSGLVLGEAVSTPGRAAQLGPLQLQRDLCPPLRERPRERPQHRKPGIHCCGPPVSLVLCQEGAQHGCQEGHNPRGSGQRTQVLTTSLERPGSRLLCSLLVP